MVKHSGRSVGYIDVPQVYRVKRSRVDSDLALGIPLIDLAWVVFFRWRIGQPFYQGDTNHLSHRLVRAGLGRVQAVMVIWLLAGVLGALACLI